MMPKQLPDISQDAMTIEDASDYARGIMTRLKASDVEAALKTAFLMGAKKGFCVGYKLSDIENEKVYTKIIKEYKKRLENYDTKRYAKMIENK